jgi:hypothetical protein
MEDIVQYSYKPRKLGAIVATLLFLAGGLFMAQSAKDNERGLIIDSLITLDQGQASIFLGVVALLCFGLVLVGLNAVRLAFVSSRHVTLSLREIVVPAWLPGSGRTVIPLGDIAELKLLKVRASLFSSTTLVLVIRHHEVQTRVSQRLFESKERFEDFLARLQVVCRSA